MREWRERTVARVSGSRGAEGVGRNLLLWLLAIAWLCKKMKRGKWRKFYQSRKIVVSVRVWQLQKRCDINPAVM